VLLGGAAPLEQQGRGALQEMDQLSLLKPITKWTVAIHQTARIPELLTQAIRIATSGRPGPVFVEVPFDVLLNFLDEDCVKFPTNYRTTARMVGDTRAIDAAAQLIAQSSRATILAGTQVYWDDASDALRAFAEQTNMPVYTNGMGRGTLPMDHPNCLQLSRGNALRESDLVIAIGTPMDFRLKYGEFGRETKVIQIDVDPTELGRNRAVEVGIVGSARAVLEQLLGATTQGRPYDAWLARLQGIEEERRTKQAQWERSDARPIHQYRLAHELNRFIDADTLIIGDGGDVVGLAAKVLTIRKPARWMDPGPLGCLGVGLPFALAAQLLHPDKKVIVLNGDGSFALNGMEFDTAARFKLPIVTVIGNDGQWGEIRIPQIALMGAERAIATQLTAGTRYDKIAEAFGGYGELVEDPNQIVPALQRAVASGKPSIVNVLIDPDGVKKADAVRAYVL
jgi:acetolactate synthase-1/2/3 large subunit